MRYLHPNDMKASVLGRTGETVDPLNDAQCSDWCMVLVIGVTGFCTDVPLEPSRVPHFDGTVRRPRHKEGMIRSHD
jgi:hypothetical protein